jgi:hypothetical protein
VSEISGNQLEVVMNGGGGDLEIGVSQRVASLLQLSPNGTHP